MGRPPKITPEYLAPYFEGLRLGMSQERAGQLAQIGHTAIARAKTLRWFQEAEKDAQAECIRRRLERISQAGQGGFVLSRKTTTNQNTGVETVEESFARPEWTADAWVLERRFPDDFAKREPEQPAQNVHFYVNGTAVNPV